MKQNKANIITFLTIILSACTMLIVINFYTIKTLSATRAFINGESRYSKGHNVATRNLINYILTHKITYWEKFKDNINIPLGDGKARIALINKSNTETIKQGFREGKNHEDDLNDMIWLFNNFKNIWFLKNAILEWETGDKLNFELLNKGNLIYHKIKNNELNLESKIKTIKELDEINIKLAKSEERFSNLLGYGTRKTNFYLLLTNIFFICIIISSISIYYSSMLKKIFNSTLELNHQKKQLEKTIYDLEKTREDLSTEIIQHKKIIGTISHDIRSPIKYIQIIAKQLSRITNKTKENSLLHNYANSIYKSTSQLNDFTKTLIEYTKIYIEGRDYYQHPYSVYDLVESKKIFFNDIAERNNTKIINKTPKNLISDINIKIIAIVIHNLIDNAVKNTLDGIIEIGVRADSDKISYWVKDSGSGMSDDIVNYYTDLFQKRDPEKLILSTYGIGLHLVLELLFLIKGNITFSKPKDKGTLVTIDINLKPTQNLT